LIFSNI